MKFRKYEDIKEFANDTLDLLCEKEWLNNLMVGNIEYGLENGIDDKWLLATVEDGKKIELIMLLRRPWKLVMYSPTGNNLEELYKFAAEEVYKVDKDLPGVNTEKSIAEMFAKNYCEVAKKNNKVAMPMRILLIENLQEQKVREDVLFRRATLEDKEILKKFINDFHIEALHKELKDEELEAEFNKHFIGDKPNYFVLEKDGKIVSQTVSSRRLKKGKCVSGVYTPPEERKKGYAYTLVYLATKEYFDNGAEYCVLFTDDSNPISNHVYEKIGYKRMVDTEDIDFI